MLKKNILAAAFVLGTAVLSAHASAQSSQAYMGASLGRAKWDFDCKGATGCHTAAASAKFFGGYHFNPYFGLEGSYVYMNEVSANDPLLKATFNARGIDFAAVAKTPVYANFTGFAKLGFAFMKGEITATLGNLQGSETHYSSQPLGGLGVIYQIDAKMSLRAEVDYRKVKVAGFEDSTFGATTFSIGIQSEF